MDGWTTETLGEACDLIARGVAPKYLDEGGICVLNQRCIRDHTIDYGFSRRHDQALKAVKPDRLIQIGDVLVNSTGTGTLGRVAQVRRQPPEPTTVDTHVTIVRPKPHRFHSDFFGFVMICIEDQLAASGEGTSGQTELSRTAIAEKFDISYPNSIEEQKRIVAILDEAFDGLDKAIANTEKNLANARELFSAQLNAAMNPERHQGDAVMEGWQTKALGELCEIELGKTPARANASFWDAKRETSNVWLSIADLLKAEDNVVVDSKEYVSDKGAAICKLVPKGTLLVSFKLTLGRLAFAGRDLFTNEAIAALTIFNERELSKEFLFYCLTVFDWVKAAENDVKFKGMTLNKAKLKVMPVSFPSLPEQKRIVAILDEMKSRTDRLGQTYEARAERLRALKQSILSRAFTGQLSRNAAMTEAPR